MKEHYLDIHSTYCEIQRKKSIERGDKWEADFCTSHPERFLFLAGNEFFLVAYHKCMESANEYEFKKLIVEKVIERFKIFELYNVRRSVSVMDELRNFRIRNKSLRKYIQQVNFIYGNSTKYAITTTTKYFDYICNTEIIEKNYDKAQEFLEKNELYYLKESLKEIYFNNYIQLEDYAEYHKTIDHLIKSINQKTNGNNKESKRKGIIKTCIQHNDATEV